MWDILVPYPLIEALNGILWVILLWMFVFGLLHFRRLYVDRRRRIHNRWRAIVAIYEDAKPEVALMTFVGALCIRTLVLWYLRYCRDHDYEPHNIIANHGAGTLVAMTGVMIIGVACWIRVISPYTGRHAVVLWVAMVSSALAFGIGLAIY